MKITFESRDFTPTEKYLMTKSPSIISVKDLEDGYTLNVKGYLEYEDENSKGETSYMMSIIGIDGFGDNVVISTQSATFKRNFEEISEIFENEPFTIKKISGTTKAGRPYVNCDLAQ
jgi:hypothetical protein